jgi:YesN/AraC family two-component response regulator
LKKFLKSKTGRIFILWYSCLFLIASSVVTSVFIKELKQEKKAYTLNLKEEVESITNFLGQNFIACINSSNSIFSAQWYQHYRNVAGIYKDEFHGMKKMEIMKGIASKVAALPFIYDILIVTPPPINSIISRNGWFSIDDYHKIYKTVNIEFPRDSITISLTNEKKDSYCYMILKDTTPRLIESVICIIIDKKTFANTVQRIIPDRATYFRAEILGQILYEEGSYDKKSIVSSATVNLPNFSITTAFPSYEDSSFMKERIINYTLVLLFLLIVGAFISAFVTNIVLKPISQIIKNIVGNFKHIDDPYSFITQHIEHFSEQNKVLMYEKDKLDKSMEHFFTLIRDEMFFGLLTNSDYDSQNDSILVSMPWINKEYPYILVVLEHRFQENIKPNMVSKLNELTEDVLHYCTFSFLYNDLCILFWFENENIQKRNLEKIKDRVFSLFGKEYFVSISELLQDIKHMGKSYLLQKSEILKKKESKNDLQISFQVDLINNLQGNKQDKCIKLLNSAKFRYNPEAVMRLLVRIASKYDIDSTEYYKKYYQCERKNRLDAGWEVLTDFGVYICRSISDYKNLGMEKTVKTILAYIDKHYCDPNLCMKQLSEVFSLNRSSISSIIKSHIGITYSEYVLGLRIKKSMELLESTEMNIYEIGESVGYENYLTFKRAFLRYKGISPREFRMHLP